MDRVRLFAVAGALLLAVLGPLMLSLSGMLAKSHMVSADFAFHVLIAKLTACLFALAALASVIACALAFFVEPKGGRAAAIICLIASLVPGLLLASAIARASGAPALHDLSTDSQNPPEFSERVAMLRKAKDHSLAVDADALTLHAKRYSKIKSMPFAASPASVFDATLHALQNKTMSIVTADKEAGVIEATGKTPWLGMDQDVVVRIRSTDSGSLIDIRAATREGQTDYGANAQTIRALQHGIKGEFAAS